MIDEVIGIIEKLLSVEGVELARRATKKAVPKVCPCLLVVLNVRMPL